MVCEQGSCSGSGSKLTYAYNCRALVIEVPGGHLTDGGSINLLGGRTDRGHMHLHELQHTHLYSVIQLWQRDATAIGHHLSSNVFTHRGRPWKGEGWGLQSARCGLHMH